MMKGILFVVLVGVFVIGGPGELIEGKIIEIAGSTGPYDYYGHYPVVIDVPDPGCEKRFKDIVIGAEKCSTIPVINWIKLPVGI